MKCGKLGVLVHAALNSVLGVSYSYSPDAQLAQRIPHTQPGDGSQVGREFQYDSLQRLVRSDDYTLIPGGWQNVCGGSQVVDADGNPCLVPTPGAKTTTNVHTFAYDSVGNRTDSGAVVTAGNRLVRYGGDTLVYDLDGNLVERQRLTGGFEQTYGWNSLGQLVEVVTNGDTVRFAYDGFGRRVRKTTASDTASYLYDGQNLFAELDAAGNRVAEYTYYPGIDQPHSVQRWVGGTPSMYYYAMEYPNNVVGLISRSNMLVNHYGYRPFGTLEDSSETVPNALRFGARAFDRETGLYYNRARYYDPTLGRFLSEDPIGLAGGINPYVYAGNGPINRLDPLGLMDECHVSETTPCPLTPITVIGHHGMENGADPISGLRIEPPRMIGGGAYGGGGGGSGNKSKDGGLKKVAKLTLACTLDHYGVDAILGAVGAGAVIAGLPRVAKPFVIEGSSAATSVASTFFRSTIKTRLPFRILAPTLERPLALSIKLGTVLGRWTPIVGWGLLAYDAYRIGSCVHDHY